MRLCQPGREAPGRYADLDPARPPAGQHELDVEVGDDGRPLHRLGQNGGKLPAGIGNVN